MRASGYDEDPVVFSDYILGHAEGELIDSVGGGRGTSPSHISTVMKKCEGVAPRNLMETPAHPSMQLSGMLPVFIKPESGFQRIVEHCNLMEFVKFKKLMGAYKRDDAMDVCVAQREKRAEVLPSNADANVMGVCVA